MAASTPATAGLPPMHTVQHSAKKLPGLQCSQQVPRTFSLDSLKSSHMSFLFWVMPISSLWATSWQQNMVCCNARCWLVTVMGALHVDLLAWPSHKWRQTPEIYNDTNSALPVRASLEPFDLCWVCGEPLGAKENDYRFESISDFIL